MPRNGRVSLLKTQPICGEPYNFWCPGCVFREKPGGEKAILWRKPNPLRGVRPANRSVYGFRSARLGLVPKGKR